MFAAGSTQQDGEFRLHGGPASKPNLFSPHGSGFKRPPIPRAQSLHAFRRLFQPSNHSSEILIQEDPNQLTKHVAVDGIRVAITNVSKYYGIEPRVLLGIIMEESHGGVGVVTTYDAEGVPTGGLMQASNCHGYDGKNNLAQVMRTHTPPPLTSESPTRP